VPIPTGDFAFVRAYDSELQDYLRQSGVQWDRLDETARKAAEGTWRAMYGQAFRSRPRLRCGVKAEHEYQREPCTRYRIAPFAAGVPGLPVHVLGRQMGAYECQGPLVPLGAFCNVEFFVCPMDFSWAMIHTYEDHRRKAGASNSTELTPRDFTPCRTAFPSARSSKTATPLCRNAPAPPATSSTKASSIPARRPGVRYYEKESGR